MLINSDFLLKNKKRGGYSTISFPLIPPWPEPHGTEQKNGHSPFLSAMNSTVVVFPGNTLSFTPNSDIANPWVTSSLLMVNLTVSPSLTVIVDGSNSHCLAVISNSF